MQLARKSPAHLVRRRRYVFQQQLPGRINLLQPIDRLVEVAFGELQLPDETGREPDLLQHPGVFA